MKIRDGMAAVNNTRECAWTTPGGNDGRPRARTRPCTAEEQQLTVHGSRWGGHHARHARKKTCPTGAGAGLQRCRLEGIGTRGGPGEGRARRSGAEQLGREGISFACDIVSWKRGGDIVHLGEEEVSASSPVLELEDVHGKGVFLSCQKVGGEDDSGSVMSKDLGGKSW